MRPIHVKQNRRRQNRLRGVMPVRVRGKNASGTTFEELAHTLDFTATGLRLGSIRCELKTLDSLTVLYRQRRIDFKVVWIKLLDCGLEYQVGLQSFSQENEPWGMSFFGCSAVAA